MNNVNTGIQLVAENYHQFSRSGNIFIVFSADNGSFYKYDLKDKKQLPAVNFPVLVNDKFRYFFSDSLLYILRDEANTIDVYNANKQALTKRFFLPDSTVSISSLFTEFYIDKNSNVNLYSIPRLSVMDTEEARKYFSSAVLSNYHLSDSSVYLNYSTGKFPDLYKENLYGEYYPCAANLSNGNIAYIFSDTPKIYIASKNGCEVHTIHGLIKNKLINLNRDSLAYHEYGMTSSLKNEKYEWLLRDDVNNRFYLFQTHPLVKVNPDELAIWKDQPLSIYVIDSAYNVIARKDFDHINTYVFPAFFCFEGNLYLGKIENRKLMFECYETTK